MKSHEESHAVDGREFAELRPLLFSIAYRMLSSVADAEDILQEAFLRYQRAVEQGVKIESTRAYLSAVVTRLAIDQLRSARQRRETYSGLWLPEPLLTDASEGATADADSVSVAFLLVLERLNPVERAVFLLHDVFDYDYDEIAAIVGKSAVNCRQLAARARRHVHAERPRFEVSPEQREELASRFFAAVRAGDVDELASVLAADVAVYGDGGGKVPQWTRPIVGRESVARLFAGLSRQMTAVEVSIEQHRINGEPGAILRDRHGNVTNVFMLDIADGLVRAVRSIINPDKLRHLGPVADVRALAEEAHEAMRGRQ